MYWSAKLRRIIGWEAEAKLPAMFSDDGANQLVLETLLENPAIRGDASVAESLQSKGEIVFFRKGDCLIREGSQDNDVYFLLSGDVDVTFKRQLGSSRSAPNQIGEMAAIELGRKRSATIYAQSDEVVALKVPGRHFHEVWQENPSFQRNLQIEMSTRHRERIAAGEVAKRNNSFVWFLISTGVGAASFLISWFILIPDFWSVDARAATSLVCALGIFLFTLIHNPAFFWRRCFGLVLFAMIGVFALDAFVSVEATQGLGSLQMVINSGDRETNWKLTLINQGVFLITLAICAIMDSRSNPD